MIEARRRFATAGLIAAFLLALDPVGIRAETATGAPTASQGTVLSSQEGMSALATKVLHLIVEARGAIHSGEEKRAEGELRKTLALIEHIKSVRPSTRVANHIWVAERKLDYQEPREVALNLIPIEISLADLEEVFSVQRARRHLQAAAAELSGERKSQLEALEKGVAALAPPAVTADEDTRRRYEQAWADLRWMLDDD
jgi:hypothetical protein